MSIDLVGRDRTSAALNSASRSASHAESTFSKAGRSFGRAGLGMARAGGLAVVALAGVGVAGVAMGLKTAAGLQQAQIGFETMLGSAQKADRFIGKLKTFAAKTPFELPGLIDNSRQLLGVGVAARKVIPFLTDFGDAAGALGIQQDSFNRIMLAMSQSISAGKIKLGDMNQLMNNGLPIWGLLSKAIGKPVPEIQNMISHGELLTKDVLPKLQAQMHKDYGGAMAKQSQTLAGLWSTLTDTLKIGLASALMPLVPVVQKVLPGAMAALGTGLQWVSAHIASMVKGAQDGTGAGGRLAQIFHAVAGAVRAAIPAVKDLAQWIGTNLVPIVRDIATSIGPQLVATFQRIAAAVRSNKGAFTDVAQILHVLAKVNCVEVVTALKIVGVAFQAIAPIVGLVAKGVKWFVLSFLDGLGKIVHGAAAAFGWIPGLGPKLRKADEAFQRFNSSVIAIFNGLAGKGYNLGIDFANGLAQGIASGGKVAIATAQGVANRVAAGYAAAQGSHSPSKVAIALGEFFSHGLAVGIAKGGKKADAAVKDLLGLIKGKLSDLRSTAAGIASAASDAVKGVLDISQVGQAVETTTTTPGRSVIDPVTGAVTAGSDVTTTTSNTPSAASTLAGFAGQATAFAAALAAMARKGLAPALIAAVAAAGPASGLTAAQAFASESKADDTTVNAAMATIDKAALGVGAQQRAASGLDKKIDALGKSIDELNKALGAGKKATLEISKGGDLIVTYVNDTNKKNARKK